jgi:hypothetical protein
MADVKISALPSASTLSGTEELPVVQSATTTKTTINAIVAKAPVQSVAGKTGTVTLTPSDVGAEPADASILKSAAIGVTVQGYNANTVIDSAYVHTDNNYTTTEKSKLSGIAAGAEVNVNADWTAVSGDAEILNKPTLGTLSSQNSSSVSITGGSISGITDLAVADGGTGASTAAGARVSLLPSLTGNNGKVLAVNSGQTDVEWIAVSGGGGSVTSVDMAVPTGFVVSGNPITTNGTLTVTFASGYSLPTTTKQSQWDAAYGWGNHASAGYLTSSAIGTTVQAYDADLTTWAGITAPSGAVVGTTDTQTLTNKNITERVVTIADATSITINADTTDLATQANTQATGTLTVNAPTGTPVNGQKLMLRLQSSNVQTFSWNAIFAGSTDQALPTASSGSSKYDYVGFVYNSTASKWQLIAKNFGF